MQRIRTVKPEFFNHEKLYDAEAEFGLPLRLAFVGLFTVCDREGRFHWRPRTIKNQVLPFDNIDFSRVLDALATRGFVRKYESGGECFGVIPTFKKHQVINNREGQSQIPEPPEFLDFPTESTRDPRVPDACPTPLVHALGEGKGREGKGTEGNGTLSVRVNDATQKEEPQAVTPSKRFSPPSVQAVQDYCNERGNGLDAELFVDFYQARGWKLTNGKVMADWQAAVRTWEKNDTNRSNGRGRAIQQTFAQIREENTRKSIEEFVNGSE